MTLHCTGMLMLLIEHIAGVAHKMGKDILCCRCCGLHLCLPIYPVRDQCSYTSQVLKAVNDVSEKRGCPISDMFDPHAEVQLVRPDISPADALRVAKSSYGLDGSVKELGSNQDRNFFLTPSGGSTQQQRYLLKVDNDAFSTDELEAQNEALLALADSGMEVPTPIRDKGGKWITTVDGHRARLLSFVEGTSLVDDGYLSPGVVARMGTLAGRVVVALSGMTNPALERDLQWDMRNAMTVIEAYAHRLTPDRAQVVLTASRAAWKILSTLHLPIQPIHGDITDDNVVGLRDDLGRVMPTAVIDWGDLSTGWRVAEVSVTVSSLLHHQRGRTLDILPAIRAFDALVSLTRDEIRALWPLVRLRGAVVAVSGAHQLYLDPGNEYIAQRMAHEWRIFETANSLPLDVAQAAIEAALGRAVPETPVPQCLLLPDLDAEYVRLDTASPHLHRGAFLRDDTEMTLAEEVVSRGKAAVLAYGEHRFTRTRPYGLERPVNATLFLEALLPSEASVVAPFAGEVMVADDRVCLRGDHGEIDIFGVSHPSGGKVTPGDRIGVALPNTLIRIQWRRPQSPDAPQFVVADELPAWRRLTVDPAALLGLSPASWLPNPELERARRLKAVPGAAERFFEVPPEIERGWREMLYDTTGRGYIDMINNVAGIGHAHPRMADAVHEQMLMLNTNCRFLYASLADYVERLVALAPHPSLSAVMLVNSGSEAIDLALRLARAHTRRQDVVALREAYHGWTTASDAVSMSAWDNPAAEGSRPGWVHVADAVNSYRGKYRGSDAGELYAADVEALLDQMDEKGAPVGAFLCEPVFGNGGGVVYPSTYLERVYAAVRARGGVCISDEVQVGLGRLGHYTWGVEAYNVVPDIMAVAKALGNAYPLGCVYTTPEIAASLAREGMFFSSAGGATVSTVAGLAVLDIMRDEKLQSNAAVVGDHLGERFRGLMEKYPIIGHIHGMGLYQGIELVRDRTTLEPADQETEWVCERLLDHGVIMQATSERRNVLKIKPPLTLTLENADLFVDALDAVLAELEARR